MRDAGDGAQGEAVLELGHPVPLHPLHPLLPAALSQHCSSPRPRGGLIHPLCATQTYDRNIAESCDAGRNERLCLQMIRARQCKSWGGALVLVCEPTQGQCPAASLGSLPWEQILEVSHVDADTAPQEQAEEVGACCTQTGSGTDR